MHGIWLHPRSQSRSPGLAEYCLGHRGVVRQHADDEIAIEQIGNAEFRLKAEGPDFRGTVRTANIGDDPAAAGREIGCHRVAHATQPDKADASLWRLGLSIPPVDREMHVSIKGQCTVLQWVSKICPIGAFG